MAAEWARSPWLGQSDEGCEVEGLFPGKYASLFRLSVEWLVWRRDDKVEIETIKEKASKGSGCSLSGSGKRERKTNSQDEKGKREGRSIRERGRDEREKVEREKVGREEVGREKVEAETEEETEGGRRQREEEEIWDLQDSYGISCGLEGGNM